MFMKTMTPTESKANDAIWCQSGSPGCLLSSAPFFAFATESYVPDADAHVPARHLFSLVVCTAAARSPINPSGPAIG